MREYKTMAEMFNVIEAVTPYTRSERMFKADITNGFKVIAENLISINLELKKLNETVKLLRSNENDPRNP